MSVRTETYVKPDNVTLQGFQLVIFLDSFKAGKPKFQPYQLISAL